MMQRRLRVALLSVAGVVLAIVLVAVIAVYLLLQPDRFTAMLQDQARAAGLQLSLDSPASPTLFPRPALDLRGITLCAEGSSAPILLAAHGRLALPWRTLFGGPTVISQLEIDAPRVDLDALQAWLSTLPARPAGTPPSIPRIDAGVSISRGSVVRGDQLLLGNVTLDTGTLAPGQPFPLELSASTASGAPLQLRLSATPRIDGNTLQLDNIVLHLSQGSGTTLDLGGNAHWHGAADAVATLNGKLDQADAGIYTIALALTPADQTQPLLLALKLDGPDNHADLRLPPLALAHWWSELGQAGSGEAGPGQAASSPLSVPPGSGHIEVAKLETSSISIEGLTVQAGDDVPAAASTAAATGKPSAPAKTATAGKP